LNTDDIIIIGTGLAVGGFLLYEFMKKKSASQSASSISVPSISIPHISFPSININPSSISIPHISVPSISQFTTTSRPSYDRLITSSTGYGDFSVPRSSYIPSSKTTQSTPSWKTTSANGVYNIYSAYSEQGIKTGPFAGKIYGNPNAVAPYSGPTRTFTICNRSNLTARFWYFAPGTDYNELYSGGIAQQTYYSIQQTRSVSIPPGQCRTITMVGWEDQVQGGVGSALEGVGHQIAINDIQNGATYYVS